LLSGAWRESGDAIFQRPVAGGFPVAGETVAREEIYRGLRGQRRTCNECKRGEDGGEAEV
jgi:hypothetical protein